MNILFTIIVFLVIFSVLVLVHEWGHFIMAKRAGIRVEEFGFGLPPRIWGKKKGETIYSINWIPFGGFVRMYGENFGDQSAVRSKRSFIGKPMRARVKVVVAGVVMNFLLAWILLFVGFSAGMQPLLGEGDVLNAVSEGQIVLESGLKIKQVTEGSLANQIGFKTGDNIYAINGETVNSYNLAVVLEKDPSQNYQLFREGKSYTYTVTDDQLATLADGEKLGLEFYDYAQFPRVKIFSLENYTSAYRAGLRAGDTIVKVNDQQVFNILQYEGLVRGVNNLEYEVYRNGVVEKFIVERAFAKQVLISEVLPDGPAAKAGLKEGDKIISVNGKEVTDSLELIKFTKENQNNKLAYLIERGGQRIFYEIQPEGGRIGVFLSELMNYGADQGMALYNIDLLSSVTEIKDEKYPWYQAIYKSFGESIRLSKLTAQMFVGFIGNLVRSGDVPESVAGPVGIAQMTHVFVQEGFIPVIRFVAILSLSLAVINILPFPALDGGRLLFILIEFIIGRRINPRWESYIHAFGYLLILLLILAVTYSDIMKLIGA